MNHPNFQQNVVDNVQYIANAIGPNPSNLTDQLWSAAPNPDFGKPGAIVPKFGSRSFQFSTKFSFWRSCSRQNLEEEKRRRKVPAPSS